MSLAASLTTGAALYVSLSYDLSCFHTCSYIVSAMLALLTVRATSRSFLRAPAMLALLTVRAALRVITRVSAMLSKLKVQAAP